MRKDIPEGAKSNGKLVEPETTQLVATEWQTKQLYISCGCTNNPSLHHPHRHGPRHRPYTELYHKGVYTRREHPPGTLKGHVVAKLEFPTQELVISLIAAENDAVKILRAWHVERMQDMVGTFRATSLKIKVDGHGVACSIVRLNREHNIVDDNQGRGLHPTLAVFTGNTVKVYWDDLKNAVNREELSPSSALQLQTADKRKMFWGAVMYSFLQGEVG
ncbi:hypothetical protein B0H14DRAFT_2593212 [Mycena olivaceomarginata]|nr:hypothetical protein B0H14DRAFT_2593212 [Mycena olivaceomarginata]